MQLTQRERLIDTMKALVIAERGSAARELAGGARGMADEVVLISFGDVLEGVADKVVHITVPEDRIVDDAADTVIAVFGEESPDIVLVESSRAMKVIGGKLAAHTGVSTITNVSSFQTDGAMSLYFGGMAERIQKASGSVAIYIVNGGVFKTAEPRGSSLVEERQWVEPTHPIKLLASRPIEKCGVDLTKADVVVGVGRGFSEEEQLDLARTLCERLGAGLGCTRPLSEGVNWLPAELYIGVSGLMLTPDTYIAIGVSGQMQHMVGCNRARTLFAINKDKNALVFSQCDYGLVGSIKDILPALNDALKADA